LGGLGLNTLYSEKLRQSHDTTNSGTHHFLACHFSSFGCARSFACESRNNREASRLDKKENGAESWARCNANDLGEAREAECSRLIREFFG
jgi:hypothetical protein